MFADIRQMVVNNAHGCTLSVCPHEAQAARPHYAVHTAAFDGQQGRSMVSLNAQQSARLAAVQVSSTYIFTQLKGTLAVLLYIMLSCVLFCLRLRQGLFWRQVPADDYATGLIFMSTHEYRRL